jgi:hypothetical protein
MLRVLEFLTSFYWVLLPETILSTFRRSNWRRAHSDGGVQGIFIESIESLIGTNTYVFFTPIDGKWTGHQIRKLLRKHGIDMWGWGFASQELFFHVRRDDAWKAQEIMIRAGVELLG